MKLHFDNALIATNIEAAVGEICIRERFWKIKQCQEIRLQEMWVMTSWSCYANSNVNVTLIIVIVHFSLIQLWWSFFQNFVNDDVVSTQTWEVLNEKNHSSHLKYTKLPFPLSAPERTQWKRDRGFKKLYFGLVPLHTYIYSTSPRGFCSQFNHNYDLIQSK